MVFSTGVKMIQRISLFLSFFACIAILVLGWLHWKEKIQEVGEKTVVVEETNGTEHKEDSSSMEPSPREKLEILTSNLPKEAAEHFLQAFDEEKKVKIMFIGSSAMGVSTNGWSAQVKESLEKTYGDLVDVVLKEHNGTSIQYIQSGAYQTDIDEMANIIVWEPFTIQDNSGLILIEHSIDAIEIFYQQLQQKSPESVLILQPPQPIYGAVNYPKQVEAIQTWAEENGVYFIDHWPQWPDYDSEAFLEYVDGQGLPNEKGHELWANSVIDLFVNDVAQ